MKFKSDGFTLLEVIIALAVVSVALLALIESGSQSVTTLEHLQSKTLAHWVATNEANRLQVTKAWPDNRTVTGESELAERDWFWEMTAFSTADENLKRVEIEVSKQKDGSPLARVVTLLTRPTGKTGEQ